eukprot:TRINITY_DN26482_c0_g1_i1.p1 TRINITY_DN26482_c0_g1~~TRINITY_DN26482_c0_g1_i1.p1  ORF type:complete len:490 (+),score=173.03 TRINITY_DN26482_c0_g1_i1:92-1471(+)
MSQKVIQKLMKRSDLNRQCIDCGTSPPQWVNIHHAVLLCADCSGAHRGMGTHLSYVRAIGLDEWTPEQVHRMGLGGNDRALEFLNPRRVPQPRGRHECAMRWCHLAAFKYRDMLDALCGGRAWDEAQFVPPAGYDPALSADALPEGGGLQQPSRTKVKAKKEKKAKKEGRQIELGNDSTTGVHAPVQHSRPLERSPLAGFSAPPSRTPWAAAAADPLYAIGDCVLWNDEVCRVHAVDTANNPCSYTLLRSDGSKRGAREQQLRPAPPGAEMAPVRSGEDALAALTSSSGAAAASLASNIAGGLGWLKAGMGAAASAVTKSASPAAASAVGSCKEAVTAWRDGRGGFEAPKHLRGLTGAQWQQGGGPGYAAVACGDDEDEDEDEEEEALGVSSGSGALGVGDIVIAHSLARAPEYNGRRGRVVRVTSEGRYLVDFGQSDRGDIGAANLRCIRSAVPGRRI